MFWFVLLLLLAGAGFYFYQKMMDIEREIRAEQEAGQVAAEVTPTPAKKPVAEAVPEDSTESEIVTPEVEKMTAKVVPVADASLSLEDEIMVAVKNLPGVKQTELYKSFADVNKKQLQLILKDLADGGKLKREKKGSSYLLYPA